jgi:formyltetrahydrofolate synthetase
VHRMPCYISRFRKILDAPRTPMSDPQIARFITLKHLFEVAQTSGIHSEDLIPFGCYRAKVTANLEERAQCQTARTVRASHGHQSDSSWGREKTTSIGLSMVLCHLGHRPVVTWSQPFLGSEGGRYRKRASAGMSYGGYQSTFYG